MLHSCVPRVASCFLLFWSRVCVSPCPRPQMVLRPSFLPVSMLDFPMAIVFQASIGSCGMKGICFSSLMCCVSMWAGLWRRSEDSLTGWFFPSMTWVLGIEIRSSDLAASAFTQLSNLASLEGHSFLIWCTGVPLCPSIRAVSCFWTRHFNRVWDGPVILVTHLSSRAAEIQKLCWLRGSSIVNPWEQLRQECTQECWGLGKEVGALF